MCTAPAQLRASHLIRRVLIQWQSFACAYSASTCASAMLQAHLGKPVQGRLQSIPGYIEMIVGILP